MLESSPNENVKVGEKINPLRVAQFKIDLVIFSVERNAIVVW